MLSVNDVKKWMSESDHSQEWLARQCGVSLRTARNWLTTKNASIPKKQQERIGELMKLDKKIPYVIPVELHPDDFLKLERKTKSENIPIAEYCARAVIDSL